jgi:hypothetical protein
MKRRTFIYTGIAVATGLSLSGLFLWNKDSKWKKQPFLYPFILSGFLDEDSLRVIGKTYRVQRPGENSTSTLMNAIINGMHADQAKMNDLENQVLEIEKNVEMDFKEDKLIVIKGWIMSETEARQCALLSLS